MRYPPRRAQELNRRRRFHRQPTLLGTQTSRAPEPTTLIVAPGGYRQGLGGERAGLQPRTLPRSQASHKMLAA